MTLYTTIYNDNDNCNKLDMLIGYMPKSMGMKGPRDCMNRKQKELWRAKTLRPFMIQCVG